MASARFKVGTPRRRELSILLATLVVVAAGVSGFLAGRRSHPAPPLREANRPPALALPDDIEPAALISIRSAADASTVRDRVNTLLWGQTSLPAALPDREPSFLEGAERSAFDGVAASIETLVTRMDGGLESRALHFVPKTPNGELVIVHEGHAPFRLREREIVSLLGEGYGVVALWMPLMPPNPQPEVRLPTGETIVLTSHEQLAFLTPAAGHPVRYLIEPSIRILNYAERSGAYRRFSMIGLSGGGWTTVVVAAIDPRVAVSVPIAGSFPLYLRALDARDWGDWEETLPELFGRTGYLDLYLLGATGCGRAQRQLFNEHDPCCYGGTASREYEPAVRDAVAQLGDGTFDVVIDHKYREHGISPTAWRAAMEAVRRARPCR